MEHSMGMSVAEDPVIARPTDMPVRAQRAMLAIYTLTIFAASALLFVVQPMVAKILLPLLGGSPSSD